jgi:hypothetical protein
MSWPALTDHLATLTEQGILEYYECFEKMHGTLYGVTCGQPPTSSEAAAQTTASSTSGPDLTRRDTSRVRRVSAAERP